MGGGVEARGRSPEKARQGMRIFIDYQPLDDCLNFWDSWGQVCTQCNCCGRFSKKSMYRDRMKTYRRALREEKSKVGNAEYSTPLQQENIQKNIRFLRAKIANAAKCEKARKARRVA